MRHTEGTLKTASYVELVSAEEKDSWGGKEKNRGEE